MKKFYILVLAFWVAGFLPVFSQDKGAAGTTGGSKNKVVQNDYSRNGLTVVFLNFEKDKYAADLKTAWSKLNIIEKFDNNQINIDDIKAPFDMRLGNCAGGGAAAALLAGKDTTKPRKAKEVLAQQKFAHKIIGKWFNMTPDGTVSLETIFKRGQYNATDADYKAAMDSKRKDASLKDAGYELIKNSYIVAIDFGNILTMEEYYEQMEKNKKALGAITSAAGMGNIAGGKNKRPKTGYITDIRAYLYQVDFSSDVMQTFWDMFQEIKGDDTKWKIDVSKYDAMSIPLKFVKEVSFPRVEGNEYKTGHLLAPATPSTKEQLFVKLVNNGFEAAEMMFTRKVPAFRVKAPVAEAKKSFIFPNVKAKIGKKESVKLDKRFFVYEKVEDKGKVVSKRRGVVRASNDIVDNRSNTTGNTGLTKFYQISGKKLEDAMLMEERPDFGLGLFVGAGIPISKTFTYSDPFVGGSSIDYEYTPALAITGRLEYNVSPVIAKVTKKFFSEVRLFVEARILGEETLTKEGGVTIPSGSSGATLDGIMCYGGGISKDIHITRKIKLAPFAQYLIGSTKQGGASVGFIGFGARLPININYWLSLVPSATMFTGDNDLAHYWNSASMNSTYFDIGLRLGF
ncbi:MAG: hypothetical protein HY958_07640 [Bacteroidia bacterium]|nr:hypothetical protein [Bacteroidia bacterium]